MPGGWRRDVFPVVDEGASEEHTTAVTDCLGCSDSDSRGAAPFGFKGAGFSSL